MDIVFFTIKKIKFSRDNLAMKVYKFVTTHKYTRFQNYFSFKSNHNFILKEKKIDPKTTLKQEGQWTAVAS